MRHYHIGEGGNRNRHGGFGESFGQSSSGTQFGIGSVPRGTHQKTKKSYANIKNAITILRIIDSDTDDDEGRDIHDGIIIFTRPQNESEGAPNCQKGTHKR